MKNIWNKAAIQCYSSERGKYYQYKREDERKEAKAIGHYIAGFYFMHSRFRIGKIVEIVGTDVNRYAWIDFQDMETKKLLLKQVKENCGRCA